MPYYDDLSAYSYLGATPQEHTLNVGWLDKQHGFPTGSIETRTRQAIFDLCLTPVNKTRGYHQCPFCSPAPLGLVVEENGKKLVLGSAEIRVQSGSTTYAAPDLIYHYITAHSYLPPSEFIDSLK